MPSGHFCWYELATTDPDGAKKFYGDLLGWTFEDSPMPGDHPGTYTMINRGKDGLAGLYKLEGPMAGLPPHWGSYVASDDVDATAAKAREFGGEIINEPMDIPGIGRMATFKGPEGAAISCFKWAQDPGGEAPQGEGTFVWSELLSDAVDKSKAFYTKVFGWDTESMGPEGHYQMFKAGDAYVGGLMAKPEEMGPAPSAWFHYITVDDIEAKTKQAQELGAKILVNNQEVENMGRFTTLQDPQGAVVSIWKSAH